MNKGFWAWLALYLVIAGVYCVFLLGYGMETALRGALVVAIFVLLAIGAVRSIFRAQEDQRLVRAALAGRFPVDGQRCAVLGTVVTLGPALTSPFSRTLCAAYRYQIYHREEMETEEGTAMFPRPDFMGTARSPVAVRTRRGDIRLNPNFLEQGFPEGPLDGPSHFANAVDYLQVTRFADRSGLNKVNVLFDIQEGNQRARAGGEVQADWRTSKGSFTLDPGKHTLYEMIVPINERVCAIGQYDASKRELVPQPAKVLKLLRGVPVSTPAQAKSEARQKVGAAIFLLAVSHIGLFMWLSTPAVRAGRAGAALAQSPPEPVAENAVASPVDRALTAGEIPSPRPVGWAVDLSGRIPRETLNQLDRLGDEVKARRSAEVAVAVVPSFGPVPSSQLLAADLFQTWRLDPRGILLLVSLDGPRVEILLGRGLATLDRNRKALWIVKGVVIPRLRADDPGGAVLAGANAAATQLLDFSSPVTEPAAAPAAPK